MSHISNSLSSTAQATLLLTSYFSKPKQEDEKPLTITEWGRFASWLHRQSLNPADLLNISEQKKILSAWMDKTVSVERIIKLLERGHSLAFAVEKWQRAGLWILTRSDPEYPKRLKQRLKANCPPVLFGCGDKKLLNGGGLAVIGSRNASEEDLAFTDQIGLKAALEAVPIISGGARGVDERAMLASVNQGGITIGIMADSLLKTITNSKWRKGLMEKNLVLVSPFYPEAGFSVGNAMARNKYIYCLSDSALVIHSGKKGGTLSGAEENLKRAWVPLWVKESNDKDSANEELVSKGGGYLKNTLENLKIVELQNSATKSPLECTEKQPDLFSQTFSLKEQEEKNFLKKEFEESSTHQQKIEKFKENEIEVKSVPTSFSIDFYQLFIRELQNFKGSEIFIADIIKITDLKQSQLTDWFKRAEEDEIVKKIARPVRYKVL